MIEIEIMLKKIMEDYNINMILFTHPDLGTVQLTKGKIWYIQGRKHKNISKEEKQTKSPYPTPRKSFIKI